MTAVFESLTYQGTMCAEYFRICFLLPCQDCVRAASYNDLQFSSLEPLLCLRTYFNARTMLTILNRSPVLLSGDYDELLVTVARMIQFVSYV